MNLRILMTEGYVGNEDLIVYYGATSQNGIGDISHLPINFNLVSNFRKSEVLSANKVGTLFEYCLAY